MLHICMISISEFTNKCQVLMRDDCAVLPPRAYCRARACKIRKMHCASVADAVRLLLCMQKAPCSNCVDICSPVLCTTCHKCTAVQAASEADSVRQMCLWDEQKSFVPGKRHDSQHYSYTNHNYGCRACPESHLQGT